MSTSQLTLTSLPFDGAAFLRLTYRVLTAHAERSARLDVTWPGDEDDVELSDLREELAECWRFQVSSSGKRCATSS